MDWIVDMFHFIKDWWFLIAFVGGLAGGGYKGIKTLNDSLVDIKNELKISNMRFEDSIKDRKQIWEKLYRHDEELDRLDNTTIRHDTQIEFLRKERT